MCTESDGLFDPSLAYAIDNSGLMRIVVHISALEVYLLLILQKVDQMKTDYLKGVLISTEGTTML